MNQTQPLIDSVINQIKSTFPIKSGDKTLTVSNLRVSNTENADPTNYHAISRAKRLDKTYGVAIMGDVTFTQANGKTETKTMKLATVPTQTGDGTYVVQGVQYQINNQLRLRPGFYSRTKQNGEIEAHVNPDGFKQIRLGIDPETKNLSINVNQAKINAIPVLSALGVSHEQMKRTFGADVYKANTEKLTDAKMSDEIRRFYRSVNPYAIGAEQKSVAEMAQELSEAMKNAKLDPKVTEITMGKKFDRLDGGFILRGLEKVLNVSRKIEDSDDRDALAFKTLHSTPDFVTEKLRRSQNGIRHQLASRLRKSDDLTKIVSSQYFSKPINSFFNSAALSENPSQINPIAMLKGNDKVTITGEGGIENPEAIMPDSQALHPTHLGFLDPVNTPESNKIGVVLNMTVDASKRGNEIVSKFKNVKTNKVEELSALQAFDKVIALPQQKLKGKVTAIHRGKQVQIDAAKVTHQLRDTASAFGIASQFIPLQHHDQGNRLGMATRQIAQAISLENREAPLVQTSLAGEKSIESLTANSGNASFAIKAPENGSIKQISKSHIIFSTSKGDIKIPYYKDFELQNKSYLTHEGIDKLQVGQKFKKDELIADSNFTKNGTLALGSNLRVAYMPWKGLNFEDGIVVSETAAKKLTSNHMIQTHIAKDGEDVIIDKKKFMSLYPTKYTKEQLAKIDDNGLAKPGVILEPGDPTALTLQKTTGTNEDLMFNRLHRSLVQPYQDASQTWTALNPGEVVAATVNRSNAKVSIKTKSPAIVGDKLSMRHGNKGVITAIVADKEMPQTAGGASTEVIISPASVITRMTPGQLIETAASKIAEKTGKPYLVKNFDEKSLEKVKADLKKHGISDTETLIDPVTKKEYGKVLVGRPVIQKLFKTATANVSARDVGMYDMDNKPIKGGEDGSKAVDPLTLYSLLSHGKRNVVSEISTVRGDGNADYWQNLENGLPLPKPQVPFIYNKFEATLNAAGVNVRTDGSKRILAPMTDKDALDYAGTNELRNFKMLDHKRNPIKGGLFDRFLTGGSNGQKWSKITLAHPIVNPMFASPVKTLLGMTEKQFQEAIKDEDGHKAISEKLSGINVRGKIDQITKGIKTAPKTKQEAMLKELKLLKALEELGMKPKEAYMTSVVPVMPPQFRPAFELPSGNVEVSSLNMLYRDLGVTNEALKSGTKSPELTQTLYQSLGAIQGVASPVSEQTGKMGAKGALRIITGEGSPKRGMFQSKVVRKQVDLTGRATVVLNNNLNMDQIAIPEKIAKTIYKPFAMKNLKNIGYAHKEAEKHIEELDDIGRKSLEAAMSDRPVLMNRAPSLHKFSIMGFQPTLTKGLSIEVPGTIVKPFSMDFDGDTATLHVPATEAARKEAFEMMPSKNLYNPRDNRLNYTPDQEAILGLHLMSQSKDGLSKINKLLPKRVSKFKAGITKADVEKRLEEIAKKYPEYYNRIVTSIKGIGDQAATDVGFSLSLKDLEADRGVVTQAYKGARTLPQMVAADAKVKAQALDDKTNNFVVMAASGARGSAEQVKQILYAPGILQDHDGKPIERPVLSNYAQGMSFPDYWTTLYGARKGSLDKQLMTSKPGALNKEIVNTSMSIVVSQEDCKTKEGLELPADDPYLAGRYLAKECKLITKEMAVQIAKKKAPVIVRSPATCQSANGICRKCAGHDSTGNLYQIGHNIGVQSAQAISEPLTQAAMKTFHLGGTTSGGGGVFGGFEDIASFLQAPKTFKQQAAMATTNGRVTKVNKGAAGGYEIFVDNTKHFTDKEPLVKPGDTVEKGTLLSHGLPHPKQALQLLGVNKGLNVISSTLQKLYQGTGIKTDRRNIETVVRGMAGFGQVTDAGTNPTAVMNEVLPLSTINTWNQKAMKPYNVQAEQAYGMVLAKPVAGFKKGTRLGEDEIQKLKGKKIVAMHQPISYTPHLEGVTQAPLKSRDWAAHLGYRYLKKGLQEGAAYGYKSDIHGYNPVLPFVSGNLADSGEGRY